MDLRKEIEGYIPYNEQEIADKEYFLKFIDTFDDVLTRNNEFGHFSSSAFVINKEREKMLVVYHNILKGWIYPGGHADGEIDLLSVARREVKEETNQNTIVLLDKIFAFASLPTPPHVKRGKFIPSHTHFDVVYLLEAKEDTKLIFREDESKGVKWISFDEACNGVDIVDFIKPVNKKLISKLQGGKY